MVIFHISCEGVQFGIFWILNLEKIYIHSKKSFISCGGVQFDIFLVSLLENKNIHMCQMDSYNRTIV